jgi:predicted MFS family arabinose efflux permease
VALRIISIIVLGTVVNIWIALAPSILGALVDYQGLRIDAAGRLISYNLLGTTVATVLAIYIVHRPGANLRLMMFVSVFLVIITSGASVWFAGDVTTLSVVRFISGLGAGLGFTVSTVAAIGTPNITRTYAILYGSPFLVGGIGLALLPYVYEFSGIESAFYGMGLINLLACGFLPFFPKTISQEEGIAEKPRLHLDRVFILMSGLVFGALFLHYVFNSGIWTYFERLGVASGMSAKTAGAILGSSTLAAILGMIAASILGNRLGYLRPIYIGTATITIATLSLFYSSSELVFGIGTALFSASITFVTPYFIAILANLIPKGLGVSTANVVTIAGFSAGPFLVSFMVASNDFRLSIFLTAVGFIVVYAMVVLFSRILRREPDGYTELKESCEVAGYRG